MIDSGGIRRAARLMVQLPRTARFIAKMDPSLSWDWQDVYLMMMTQSLRQLVWTKTKDAQKKVPTGQPELIGPDYILAQLLHNEKSKDRVGTHKWTPNARTFDTPEELDAYLRKPRKSSSK